MDTTFAYEATMSLSELLEHVSNGERITITRDGVPVAVMQSPEASRDRQKVSEAIASIRRNRKGITLGDDLTIRDLIEEGRR